MTTQTLSKSSTFRTPTLNYPTIGPTAVKFMEKHLVYGPGDLQGEDYRVDPYLAAFLDDLIEKVEADVGGSEFVDEVEEVLQGFAVDADFFDALSGWVAFSGDVDDQEDGFHGEFLGDGEFSDQ